MEMAYRGWLDWCCLSHVLKRTVGGQHEGWIDMKRNSRVAV